MNPLVNWNIQNRDHPFIISQDKIISYSDFDLLCRKKAAAFKKNGITSGDYISILSENNFDFIVNVFALWKINSIPILLNTRLTSFEIEEQINFAGSKFLILDKFLNRNFSLKGIKILTAFDEENNNEIDFNADIDTDSTAAVFFTSGSTGKAKAVELSFNSFINSAVNGRSFLKQNDDDKWLCALPFYHVGGFSIIIRTFLSGSSLILPHSLSIESICKTFTDKNPTLTSLVPTQLKRLLNLNCKPNKHLKNVLLGGGFIDDELIVKALKEGWKISKSYGSTESASFVTAIQCTEAFNSSVGKPLHPNKIFIVDEEENEMPPGKIGEIVIEGNSLAKGYLDNPEETKRKFQNGKYFTGDIGWIDDDGYLYIEARRNDLIVTGGENVNPFEVENALLKHPDILEAAVFGIKDDEWGYAVSAALVTKKNLELTAEEIKKFLQDKIAAFKIPRKIYIVDELPKSPLGKIQKQILKENLNVV